MGGDGKFTPFTCAVSGIGRATALRTPDACDPLDNKTLGAPRRAYLQRV
jgi:hypothetical protein